MCECINDVVFGPQPHWEACSEPVALAHVGWSETKEKKVLKAEKSPRKGVRSQ